MNTSLTAIRWDKCRATLSHDLLKNELGPAISKLLKILTGKVHDPDFIPFFGDYVSGQLSSIEREVNWLIENAIDSLSPKKLFECQPLINLDEDTKEWLPQIIHNLWVSRVDLITTLATASNMFRDMKTGFVELAEQKIDPSCESSLLGATNFYNKFLIFSSFISSMQYLSSLDSLLFLKGEECCHAF